jgi:hypothetical protein
MKWEQFSRLLDHFTGEEPSGPTILILDSHGLHSLNTPPPQQAVINGGFLLCLPPHSTYKVPPLDVEFSGPLKVLYDDACRTYV